MHIYKRMIRVQDTDMTGAIYFANQLKIGLEAFEDFLYNQGISIGKMMKKTEYLLPIVHAQADFLSPIYSSDLLEIRLRFSKIGNTSFTHQSNILRKGRRVGTTQIVHVVYCPKKKGSISIPRELKTHLMTHSN